MGGTHHCEPDCEFMWISSSLTGVWTPHISLIVTTGSFRWNDGLEGSWRGRLSDTLSPSLTSFAAAATTSGVRRLMVPSWSPWPHTSHAQCRPCCTGERGRVSMRRPAEEVEVGHELGRSANRGSALPSYVFLVVQGTAVMVWVDMAGECRRERGVGKKLLGVPRQWRCSESGMSVVLQLLHWGCTVAMKQELSDRTRGEDVYSYSKHAPHPSQASQAPTRGPFTSCLRCDPSPIPLDSDPGS